MSRRYVTSVAEYINGQRDQVYFVDHEDWDEADPAQARYAGAIRKALASPDRCASVAESDSIGYLKVVVFDGADSDRFEIEHHVRIDLEPFQSPST